MIFLSFKSKSELLILFYKFNLEFHFSIEKINIVINSYEY